MLFALGAASAALDAIQSLTSSTSSSAQSTGFSQASADLFGLAGSTPAPGSSARASGSTGFSQISPATLSALLAAQSQSSTASTTPASARRRRPTRRARCKTCSRRSTPMVTARSPNRNLKTPLAPVEPTLAQADHVFSQLDTNGDGTVSLGELSSALQGAGGHGGTITCHALYRWFRRIRRAAQAHERIEYRSAAAGIAGRILHVGNQQRRFNHDITDLCRRVQGHDDLAAVTTSSSTATSSYNLSSR